MVEPDFEIKIDEVSATTTYVGEAGPGRATSAAVWRIRKIDISGTVTTESYADKSTDFNKVWDDRLSYSY